jgi:hypothetical protein
MQLDPRYWPFPALEALFLAIFIIMICFLSFIGKQTENPWLKRHWKDFVPCCILFFANVDLFLRYSDLYVAEQISASFVLLTSGTLCQMGLWLHQIWIHPILGNVTTLRAGLGVSLYLDTMGLATTVVQIKKFGWSSGNVAALVVGILSLVFTAIFVVREKVRGRALWRREVEYTAVAVQGRQEQDY